jgi:hypothetical protein
MAGNTPATRNFRQSVRRGPHFRESSIKQLRKRLPCQDFVQTDQTNRRNARKSTGPISEEDKGRPRCNAIRHGLTAETVIGTLEDAKDYNAFQAAVAASFDAETAVERELVLRLASRYAMQQQFRSPSSDQSVQRNGSLSVLPKLGELILFC